MAAGKRNGRPCPVVLGLLTLTTACKPMDEASQDAALTSWKRVQIRP